MNPQIDPKDSIRNLEQDYFPQELLDSLMQQIQPSSPSPENAPAVTPPMDTFEMENPPTKSSDQLRYYDRKYNLNSEEEEPDGDSFWDNLGEGFSIGGRQLAGMTGLALSTALKYNPSTPTAGLPGGISDDIESWSRKVIAGSPEADGSAGQFIGQLLPQFAMLASAILTAPVSAPLSAALGATTLTTLGLSAFGQGLYTYDEWKKEHPEEEFNEVERLAVGTLFGVAEFAAEKIRLGQLLPKGVKGQILSQLMKKDVKQVAKMGTQVLRDFIRSSDRKAIGVLKAIGRQMLYEGLEEGGTQVAQDLIENYMVREGKLNDRGWEAILDDSKQAFFAGAVLGGALGPLSYGSQRIVNRQRREKAGRVVLSRVAEGELTGTTVELIGNPNGDQNVFMVMTPKGEQKKVLRRELGEVITLTPTQFENAMKAPREIRASIQQAHIQEAKIQAATEVDNWIDKIVHKDGKRIVVVRDDMGVNWFVVDEMEGMLVVVDETGQMKSTLSPTDVVYTEEQAVELFRKARIAERHTQIENENRSKNAKFVPYIGAPIYFGDSPGIIEKINEDGSLVVDVEIDGKQIKQHIPIMYLSLVRERVDQVLEEETDYKDPESQEAKTEDQETPQKEDQQSDQEDLLEIRDWTDEEKDDVLAALELSESFDEFLQHYSVETLPEDLQKAVQKKFKPTYTYNGKQYSRNVMRAMILRATKEQLANIQIENDPELQVLLQRRIDEEGGESDQGVPEPLPPTAPDSGPSEVDPLLDLEGEPTQPQNNELSEESNTPQNPVTPEQQKEATPDEDLTNVLANKASREEVYLQMQQLFALPVNASTIEQLKHFAAFLKEIRARALQYNALDDVKILNAFINRVEDYTRVNEQKLNSELGSENQNPSKTETSNRTQQLWNSFSQMIDKVIGRLESMKDPVQAKRILDQIIGDLVAMETFAEKEGKSEIIKSIQDKMNEIKALRDGLVNKDSGGIAQNEKAIPETPVKKETTPVQKKESKPRSEDPFKQADYYRKLRKEKRMGRRKLAKRARELGHSKLAVVLSYLHKNGPVEKALKAAIRSKDEKRIALTRKYAEWVATAISLKNYINEAGEQELWDALNSMPEKSFTKTEFLYAVHGILGSTGGYLRTPVGFKEKLTQYRYRNEVRKIERQIQKLVDREQELKEQKKSLKDQKEIQKIDKKIAETEKRRDVLIETSDRLRQFLPESVSKNIKKNGPLRYSVQELEQKQKRIKSLDTPTEKQKGISKATNSRREKVAQVSQMVQPLIDEFGLNASVVYDESELPATVRADIAKRGFTGRVEAVIDPETGDFFILANKVSSLEAIKRLYAHEVVSHYGLRNLLGPRFEAKMQEIYDSMDEKIISRISDTYGTSDPVEIAEEYMSQIAGTDPQLGKFQQVVAYLKDLLRSVMKVRYSRNDIVSLLKQSKRSIHKKPIPQNFETPKDYMDARYRYSVKYNPPILSTGWEHFTEWVQDQSLVLEKIQKTILERGGKIDDASSPWQELNRASSMARARMEDFTRKYFSPMMDVIDVLERDFDLSLAEIEFFLKAAHAPERNAYLSQLTGRDVNSGLDTAAAIAYVNHMYENYPPELLDELLEHTQKVSRFILDTWLSSGKISVETYKELLKRWEYYVPLRDWKHPVARDLYEYSVKEVTRRYPGFYKAKGRITESADPLGYLFNMAYASIAEGTFNEVKLNAYRMVWNNRKGNEDMFSVRKIYFVDTGHTDELGRPIYDEWDKLPPKKYFDQGRVRKHLNRLNHARRTAYEAQEHEVKVWDHGEIKIISFEDTAPARVLNGKHKIMGGEYYQRTVGDWFNTGTRFLSQQFTAKNPAFIPYNFLVDMGFAMIAHTIEKNPAYAVKFLKNVKASKGAVRRFMYGTADPANYIDAKYELFRREGGETGWIHLKSPVQIQAKINKILTSRRKNKWLATEGLELIDEMLTYMATASENASRFATFLTALESGKTTKEAILEAKNITVNFNTSGRLGTVLGSFYSFINANIQGPTRFGGLIKNFPKAAGGVAMSLYALGLVLPFLGRTWDDEEEDLSYDNISPYKLYNTITLPNLTENGKYINIPLPHGWRWFYMMGVLTNQVLMEKVSVKDAIARSGENLGNALTPVNAFDLVEENGDLGIRPIVPSTLVPAYDVWVNSDWKGDVIYRKPFTLATEAQDPEFKMGLKNTNPMLVTLSKALNRIGGGSDIRPAGIKLDEKTNMVKRDAIRQLLFEWNPAIMEHWIEYYAGGRGKFVNNLWKTIRAATDKEIELQDYNKPVLRRFLSTPRQKTFLRDYFKMKSEVELFMGQVNKSLREEDYEQYEILMQNDKMIRRYYTIRNLGEIYKFAREFMEMESIPRDLREEEQEWAEQMIRAFVEEEKVLESNKSKK